MSVAPLRLRYPATCAACGTKLARHTDAFRDPETKAITCVSCAPAGPEIDRGTAGASAAREWRRRHARRESEVRDRFGRLGGLVLAVTDDPQSTRAWAVGSNGESLLGKQLNGLRDDGIAVLHDRRIPGSRANIDHIAISPSGVFVVDAKNYTGRVRLVDRGGFFAHDYRLYVGSRDRTKLVAGLDAQTAAARAALGADGADVPIWRALCFVSAEFDLFASSLVVDGAYVVTPRALGKLLRADGPHGRETIERLERRLALASPPA
jgi:hypothetical protein